MVAAQLTMRFQSLNVGLEPRPYLRGSQTLRSMRNRAKDQSQYGNYWSSATLIRSNPDNPDYDKTSRIQIQGTSLTSVGSSKLQIIGCTLGTMSVCFVEVTALIRS
jgi:hypothetical protein